MKCVIAVLCAVFICCPTVAAASDYPIGIIGILKGKGSVVRQGKVIPAKIGLRVFEDDILQTGPSGSLGLILRDNMLLSLGPDSELIVDEFIFAPWEGKYSIYTKMVKGTAAFFAGIIAILSPESVKIETPKATIGIRGTKFAVRVEED